METTISTIKKGWGWVVVSGLGLAILGFVALGASVLTTFASLIAFGWLLVIGGVIEVIDGVTSPKWSTFFHDLILGILYAIAGIMMISNPGASALMITLFLGPFFMIGGIVRAATAIGTRHLLWGWQLAGGIVSFALGLFIYNQWPVSGLWVIGTFVGIEMVIAGAYLFSFGWFLHGAQTPPAEKLAA